MRRLYDDAGEKKALLLSVAPGHIDTSEVTDRMAGLPARWENFSIALEVGCVAVQV